MQFQLMWSEAFKLQKDVIMSELSLYNLFILLSQIHIVLKVNSVGYIQSSIQCKNDQKINSFSSINNPEWKWSNFVHLNTENATSVHFF